MNPWVTGSEREQQFSAHEKAVKDQFREEKETMALDTTDKTITKLAEALGLSVMVVNHHVATIRAEWRPAKERS